MYRRAEIAEHSARAGFLEGRALHEASHGHFGRAAALEVRSDIQRAEAFGAAMRPHHHYPGMAVATGLAVGAVGAAVAADVVAGAVVTGAIVAEEMREAERMGAMAGYAAGCAPYYPPANYYVQPPYSGGGYPPGAYPPCGPAAVYPPLPTPMAPSYGPYPPGYYPPPY